MGTYEKRPNEYFTWQAYPRIVNVFKTFTHGGTAFQVTTSDHRVDFVDLSAFGGLIAVGSANVNALTSTENGVILYPGNQPYRMPVSNVNKVYAAGSGVRLCMSYYMEL